MRIEEKTGHRHYNTIYVDWFNDSKRVILNKNEWNDKIIELKRTSKFTPFKTVGNDYIFKNAYHVEEKKGYVNLYRYEDEWITYRCMCDSISETAKIDTSEIGRTWRDKFIEVNNISPNKAFGMQKGIEFNKYVPSPCIYSVDNPYLKNIIIGSIYKADMKSAYAWAMSDILPDYHTEKKVQGKVPPSPEYPFAYYVESGHHAVHNEYTTESFNCREYPQYEYNDMVEVKTTLLYKPCKYSFKGLVDYFYNLKEKAVNPDERQFYKNILVVPTGMMRPKIKHTNGKLLSYANKVYGLYIQASVILGRVVNKMLSAVHTLQNEGNIILAIATDAIIWSGKASKVATHNKYIGDFCYEYEDAEIVIKSTNNYLIRDKHGLFTYKHMGNKDKHYASLEDYVDDKISKALMVFEYNKTTKLFEYTQRLYSREKYYGKESL